MSLVSTLSNFTAVCVGIGIYTVSMLLVDPAVLVRKANMISMNKFKLHF